MIPDIPAHAATIARAVQRWGAMVVASPGTPHVTVVHKPGQADMIDAVIISQGMRAERLDPTRVKVYPAPEEV